MSSASAASTTQTVDANFNATECLVKMDHFGYTKVHNICKDTEQIVPWGFFDWLGIIMLSGGGIIVIALLIAFVVMVIRDSRRGW